MNVVETLDWLFDLSMNVVEFAWMEVGLIVVKWVEFEWIFVSTYESTNLFVMVNFYILTLTSIYQKRELCLEMSRKEAKT